MADLLSAYLHEVAGRRFAWGATDCVMTQFEWVRRRTGIDPAAVCGAGWRSLREALAVLGSVGGLNGGGVDLYARCGFEQTSRPARGDIGVIEVVRDGAPLHIAAICMGNTWAFAEEPAGMRVVVTKPVVAWILPEAP